MGREMEIDMPMFRVVTDALKSVVPKACPEIPERTVINPQLPGNVGVHIHKPFDTTTTCNRPNKPLDICNECPFNEGYRVDLIAYYGAAIKLAFQYVLFGDGKAKKK